MPEFELGDDGEFTEAVDSRYGVYSARPQQKRFPIWLIFGSVCACAIVFAVLYAGFSA